ncbi:hypothetical protein [Anaeromyxobacter oryzae]|uniref:Uncharacterized protein n=1 Tax=Anaeromyxobacter oryzae TaxID=2918170 RepID=A0ABM7WUX2_9BACT|nr:hypothetical protein [Anaeromyxobacter oryzae]BDG03193.1 hypothetical protein AMOR_21890 [Anaeromyxobacter oryzae]
MSAAARAEVCRWLRSRSAYGRTAEGAEWLAGASTVEGYWCLRTMEPAGPDDALAEPGACRPGRACFAAAGEALAAADPGASAPRSGGGA